MAETPMNPMMNEEAGTPDGEWGAIEQAVAAAKASFDSQESDFATIAGALAATIQTIADQGASSAATPSKKPMLGGMGNDKPQLSIDEAGI